MKSFIRIDEYDREVDHESDEATDLYFLLYILFDRHINSITDETQGEQGCLTRNEDGSYELDLGCAKVMWDGEMKRIRAQKGVYINIPSAYTFSGTGGGGWTFKFTYFGATYQNTKAISYATKLSQLYRLPVGRRPLSRLEELRGAVQSI